MASNPATPTVKYQVRGLIRGARVLVVVATPQFRGGDGFEIRVRAGSGSTGVSPRAHKGRRWARSPRTGPQSLHRQPGDPPQRHHRSPGPAALPAARGPVPRRGAPPPPETGEERPESRAAGLHPGRPDHTVEPGADLPGFAQSVPRPAGDARGPRSTRPSTSKAVENSAASSTGLCAQAARAAAPAPGHLPPAAVLHTHGSDQRAARGSLRPCRPRPLGGRPHHRQGREVGHRHAGRARRLLRHTPAPARRPRRRERPERADHHGPCISRRAPRIACCSSLMPSPTGRPLCGRKSWGCSPAGSRRGAVLGLSGD